jgi:hypothetical protein
MTTHHLNGREIHSDDMALPEGKSCADCQSFTRCVAFIGARHINDQQHRCDWAPSRFHPMTRAPERPGAQSDD